MKLVSFRTICLFGASLIFGSLTAQTIEPRDREIRATTQSWAIACPAPSIQLSSVFQKSREEILKEFKDWSLSYALPKLTVEYKIAVKADGSLEVSEIRTPKEGQAKTEILKTPESYDILIAMLKSIHPIEVSVDATGHFTSDPAAAVAQKSFSLTDAARLGVCRDDSPRFLWRGKRVEETVRSDFPASITISRPGSEPKTVDLGSSVGYALINRAKAIEAMGLEAGAASVCIFYSDLNSPTAKVDLLARNIPEDAEPLKPAISAFRQMLTHLKNLNSPAPAQRPSILGSAETIQRSNRIDKIKEGLALSPDLSMTVQIESPAGREISDREIVSHAKIQLLEVSNIVQSRSGEITDSKLTPVDLLAPMIMRLEGSPVRYEIVIRPRSALKPNQLYLLASPERLIFGDQTQADYALQYHKTIAK